MKRIFLIAIFLLFTASAFAVEVTVKADTKLYNAKGEVLKDVEAGHKFRAEKRREKWVYGFLPLKGGGARGWIPLAALDLDDAARRKLAPATSIEPSKPTPTEKGDAVLLRYRFKPGQVQLYDSVFKFGMTVSAGQGASPVNTSVTMVLRMSHSFHIKRVASNGTIHADMRFRGFRVQMETVQGGNTVRLTGNERGAELYLNGALQTSGKWGSAALSDFADFSKLLRTTLGMRVNDRGEILDTTGLDALGEDLQIDLKQILGSTLVYPAKRVRPGDSWEAEMTQKIDDPGRPGRKITLAGKAKYTVLERVTHRNRRCLKLRIAAMMTPRKAGGSLRIDQTLSGITYVDEVTGIQLDTNGTISQTMSGKIMGVRITGKASGSISMTYKGDKSH
jgi:hypothetical protein